MAEKQGAARWVGSVSLGLSLIATGLVGLGCYFIPGFNGWLACQLSPIMLVVLGIEVIWSGNRGRKFGLSSAVCSLSVMGGCAALNLLYALHTADTMYMYKFCM